MELTIEYVAISEIKRAPRNAKSHDLGALNTSVRRFGYISPMIEDERTGKLVVGHGRLDDLLGMKSRSEDPPDGIQVRNDGMWLAPVIKGVRFASDSEAEAYSIADNRITELGGWNEDVLTGMLADLAAEGEEMLEGVGFDSDDLDEMLKSMGMNQKEEGEMDTITGDELLEKWDVQKGDVWMVGNHLVACGDCRIYETWGNLFVLAQVEAANGAITSPPYAEQRKSKYGGIKEEDYLDWWRNVQSNLNIHLEDDGSFFLNIKPHTVDGERVMYVAELMLAMNKNGTGAL